MNPLFSVTSVVHTYSTLLQSANYGHFNSKALKVRHNANYHSNSLGTITADLKKHIATFSNKNISPTLLTAK